MTLDLKSQKLSHWNDRMYKKHPTPYRGQLAGIVERRRVNKILSLCDINKNEAVIEIGCESGQLLKKITNAKRIVGLDISKTALSDAKKVMPSKVELIYANAEKRIKNKKLLKNSFDVVICSQTLEHVTHPEAIMENIYKLAKNDARIVISVPNELFLLRLKKLLAKIKIIDKILPGIEPTTSEWHLQIFNDKKVKKLVENKFTILKSSRVLNIYLVYLLSKNC